MENPNKIQAIVYTSNAGHTREYACMLGGKTALPVYELEEAKHLLAAGCPVIYLGWLMAGQVKGYKTAGKHFSIKALCGVGMAKSGTQVADIRKANAIPDALPVFSLQGGFEMEKLHGVYKFMMSTMQKTVGKSLRAKTDRTAEEEEMLHLMLNGDNLVSEEGLSEVLDWYQQYV